MLNIKFILDSGKTQKEIAAGLNLKPQVINNYIKGKAEPNLKTLIAIADYLHTTTDNLLDHNIPYLLDISTFTETQKNIIEMLKTFNDRQCENVEAYMRGIQGAIDSRQLTINKIKGE